MSIFIKSLKCENKQEALGVDRVSPQFSWVLSADENGAHQTAYQLTIYNENSNLIYDSNKVLSDRQFGVIADLKDVIKPYTKYDFSVTVWDENDEKTTKSSFFVTGVFKAGQWKGDWFKIWYNFGKAGYVRKEFDINSEEIDYAYCFLGATGDKVNSIVAYINGSRIGDCSNFPGATEYFRAFYTCVDVKSLLQNGKNTLSFLVSTAASIVLKIMFKSGEEQFVCTTKNNWKFNDNGAYALGFDNPMYKGKVEIFDRRKHFEGFSENGFDDNSWGYYRDPFGVISFGPLFIENQYFVAKDYKVYKPVAMKKFDDRVQIDFGTNMSGILEYALKGKSGQKITIRYGEKVNKETGKIVPGEQFPPYCEYVFATDEKERHRTDFLMIGFRYIEIFGFDGEINLEDFSAHFVHTELDSNSSFYCDDEELNNIYKVARQGFLSNLVNIPTDCPERERRGWTADAFAVAESEILNFDMLGFYYQWFKSYYDCQRKNGWIPVELPRSTDDSVDINWPLSSVFIPYEVLIQYGDTRFCNEYYDVSKSYVDLLLNLCDENYVLNPSFYSYKDWVAPEKSSPEFISAIYFYRAVWCFAKITEAIDKPDSKYYYDIAEKIKSNINKTLLHIEENKVYYDNNTQSANVHALAFGVCPDELKSAVTDSLIENIKTKDTNTTGFMGTAHILQVLSTQGREDVAYNLIKNKNMGGWLWLINECDATTFPENYNGGGSQNHAFLGSAPSVWFYKYLCGIKPLENGYKSFEISPYLPESVGYINCTLQTIFGDIKVEIKRENEVIFNIEVPVNTTAVLKFKNKTVRLFSGKYELNF